MSVFRSDIGTPTVFTTKANQGINYVAPMGGDNYVASLVSGGVILSADKGNTWGTVQSASIGPLETIYAAPSAAGAAPAGRLWAVDTLNNTRLYYSDDSGASWTPVTVFIAPIPAYSRGCVIVQQQVGVTKRLFARPDGYLDGSNFSRFAYSDDGGASWSQASNPTGHASGKTSLIIRNDGRIMNIEGRLSVGAIQYRYVDMALVWGTEVSLTGAPLIDVKANYHSGDDMVLIATCAPGNFLKVITLNAADAVVYTTVGGAVGAIALTAIDYVTPVNGISGKWVVAARNATTAYWFVSADGDTTTWSTLKSQALTGSGAGILSPCVGVT